jgi:hypothetical protein
LRQFIPNFTWFIFNNWSFLSHLFFYELAKCAFYWTLLWLHLSSFDLFTSTCTLYSLNFISQFLPWLLWYRKKRSLFLLVWSVFGLFIEIYLVPILRIGRNTTVYHLNFPFIRLKILSIPKSWFITFLDFYLYNINLQFIPLPVVISWGIAVLMWVIVWIWVHAGDIDVNHSTVALRLTVLGVVEESLKKVSPVERVATSLNYCHEFLHFLRVLSDCFRYEIWILHYL